MTELSVYITNEDVALEDFQNDTGDLSALNLKAQHISNSVEVSSLLPDTEAESKTYKGTKSYQYLPRGDDTAFFSLVGNNARFVS